MNSLAANSTEGKIEKKVENILVGLTAESELNKKYFGKKISKRCLSLLFLFSPQR